MKIPARMPCATLLGTWLLVAGCGDQATEPESLVVGSPSFAMAQINSCPSNANIVATNEAELVTAVEAASPGDVIGVDGVISVSERVWLGTDDITLTCVTPGSGIAPGPDMAQTYLIVAAARGVKIDRLVLGGEINRVVWAANYENDILMAEAVEVTRNWVHCEGSVACVFFQAVKNAVITGNYVEALGSHSGIHIEGWGDPPERLQTDGTRIQHNTVVALGPVTDPADWCAGIRPRDGTGVVVANNTVLGPWWNSIATAELHESVIEGNDLQGALDYGIFLGSNHFSDISDVDNVIRGNRVESGDLARIRIEFACSNWFEGNRVLSRDPSAVLFLKSTGANFWAGVSEVVTDYGDWDCDGDFISDPNIIPGG